MGCRIGMAYPYIIFRTVNLRSRLCLESPRTTVNARKIFLTDSFAVNNHIVLRIKIQTLLMGLDDKIIFFHPYRIIVHHATTDRRTLRCHAYDIHPSIQKSFSIFNGHTSFSHINLIHHLMVAHPINADVSACTQLRRYTVERDFQFRIGKSISCFIGWKEMVLGRLIPIRRTVFIAAVFPRSGAVSCIHIFQTAYDNIFRRIDINSERILRTGIEFGQTDIKVGKHPFACSAVQNKRYLVSIA